VKREERLQQLSKPVSPCKRNFLLAQVQPNHMCTSAENIYLSLVDCKNLSKTAISKTLKIFTAQSIHNAMSA